MEAALIRDKFDVVPSEDHDQMQEEASDSEETPYTSSDTDGEGVGTTGVTTAFLKEAGKRPSSKERLASFAISSAKTPGQALMREEGT